MALCSTGVEYGIRCLLFLVDEKGDSRESSVRTLAELQGVPPELLVKIFTRLVKAGLVATTGGVCDGFRLARLANGIDALDMIRAIDSDKSISECREVRECCAIFEDNPPSWATRNTCSTHMMMLTAQEHTEEALAQQAIPNLVRRVGRITPPEFGGEVLRWMDTSREGCGDPRDQSLTHTEQRRRLASRKTSLSTAVLIALASPPILSLEAAAEWPSAHYNGPRLACAIDERWNLTATN